MKISLKWLADYVDLKGISVDEITNKLSLCGLEVEEVIDRKKLFDKIIVGYVKEKKSHPNADKLTVCIVNDGKSDYNVVCGAPNVEAGQKVPFAMLGAVIPENEFEIKKVKIRGQISEGMICSERELGISDNHEGIMVLSKNMKVGLPLAEALEMDDALIDISITPNRSDALSIIGIARDLAAIFKKDLRIPEFKLIEEKKKSSELAAVEILDRINCPRYIGKVVTNITIKESPEWLKKKLLSIGLRPINNVVDVTNFVLMEIGQPLHAFDLDMLSGRKIVVRPAGQTKEFITLDSRKRDLLENDLMICDAEKPVAIAGVMGGENSEVTENTKNILIESAYFNPSSIRRTSKMLGLMTDASYRFERGTDPEITLWAARRAAQLIAELGEGKIAEGEIDAYPNPVRKKNIKLRFYRVKKILGYEIPQEEIKSILKRLGFIILEGDEDHIILEIPTFRPDIEREIDLIEEVGRINGYENIPMVDRISIPFEKKIDQFAFKDEIRNVLVSLGLNEIISISLLNEETAAKFGNAISVMNPKTSEMSHLRPSLIPGALTAIAKNLRVKEKNLLFFEIGNVFEKKSKDDIKSFEDFTETEHLLISITGKAIDGEWYDKDRWLDIYDLKGIVDGFFDKISLDKFNYDSYYHTNDPLFDYGFVEKLDNLVIGKGGKLKKEILDYFGIDQDVFIVNFDLTLIKNLRKEKNQFNDLLKFPKVIKDCAFILDRKVDCDLVIKILTEGSSKLLKNVKLFDIFESDVLGSDKKSLAFQMEYFDEERTLTEEEVEKDFWNAIKNVKTKLNAQLRGE